ncbi:AA permease domain-containing protein/AA permease domain-containing [Salix suchowensis]|nr:AA permease domain-containing protein/AA permease domain-containing [Salix suchowensis]
MTCERVRESFLNFSTDGEDFEETGGSAVYGHTFLSQRPSTVEWTPDLVNSASFISTFDQYPCALCNKSTRFKSLVQDSSGDVGRYSEIVLSTSKSKRSKVSWAIWSLTSRFLAMEIQSPGIFTAAIALFTDLNALLSLVSIGTLFVFYTVANAVVYRRHVA